MKLREIAERAELKFVSGESVADIEISGGFVSDMLSNVVGEANEGELWITIQTHVNILAVAMLKDLGAILIAQGEEPDSRLIEAAESKDMPILVSDLSAFELCGRLFEILK